MDLNKEVELKMKANINIEAALGYIKQLEELCCSLRDEKDSYEKCLKNVRSQLYDRNNSETVITKSIDSVLNNRNENI